VSASDCVSLGTDPCEPKHLLTQAEVLAAETNELLDLVAVGERASVIELHDHLAKPGTLTCQPAIWQAWGTKP
jgi:hypothetical protein